MVTLQERILLTLTYADIFSYPMTFRELVTWIPTSRPISQKKIQSACKELLKDHRISYIAPFYVLGRHKQNIHIRSRRMRAAKEKWRKVYQYAKWLRWIPTVICIGVTGGLSMDNAESHDDIDILIMTKPKTLWITRLFVTLFTEFVTTRRHPGEKEISDAICLNMFLTSYGLTVPQDERGWYTAHEVLQFVPLWEREHAYKKFLSANQWAEKWFSMAYTQKRQMRVHSVLSISRNISFYQFLDRFAHKIQLWYMRKRRTTEIVTASVIRFHPVDARKVIREVFTKAIKQLKIPLDKHLIRI